MTIRTIVVALAFEENGRQIADRAVQLANDHGAQLIGVHVLEGRSLHQTDLPPSVDKDALATVLTGEGRQRLRVSLKASRTPALIKVETGEPHAVIEAATVSHGADLLVIGPGVARNLREKVFGSTADRLVRCVPCPILVVRDPAPASYGHVAVGVDFSDHAKAAASFAATLAPSALRELIHAIEIPLGFEQAMLKAGASQQEIEQYGQAKARAARRRLVQVFGDGGRLPASTRMRVVRGDPATVLVNASRRTRTDLVAMGTQGANAVAQHLLGSVARKVLAGSKCDVLVTRAAAI